MTNGDWIGGCDRPAWQYALAVLAGALLALPYLAPRFFLASWVAFVPLLFAIERASLKRSYLLGLIAGVVCWAGPGRAGPA